MSKIYLADLTHTTITISNDSFPLNIGLVAAYLKKFYPELEIELFKYPDSLKEALDKKIPKILALSNYPWNTHLNLSFLKYIKNKDKGCITVMGGPNMSRDKRKQYDFLLQNKDTVDFYCLEEGEQSFKNLFDHALKNNFDLKSMKGDKINSCAYLKDWPFQEYEKFLTIGHLERLNDLEQVPSPYLTGLLDKFFDDKLSPLVETHRGCPFTCTYCHEGMGFPKKITQYTLERVKKELDYIADHIGGKVTNLMFADPNFGAFDCHLEIAEKIKETHDRTGYPKTIFASTAKNKKDNLVKISRILKGISMPIWMSVQSMTAAVLTNIKRNNISVEQMIRIQEELEQDNINSKSELILCLPGETYSTHFDSLVKLMEMKMGQIITYQLMLVNGSEMNDDLIRAQYGFQTRFRVIPRSITQLPGMDRAIETEEIVVATKDMSFEDYLEARKLHLLVSIFYNGKIFSSFFRLVEEQGHRLYDFIIELNEIFTSQHVLKNDINDFVQNTKDELFDSEAAVLKYYSEEKNFQDFLKGNKGANLLQTYTSSFYMFHIENLIVMITEAALALDSDDVYRNKVKNISKFYHLIFKDYLTPNRNLKTDKGEFDYDIVSWQKSNKHLDDFHLETPLVLLFHTPPDQYELVENYFNRFGRSPQAFGKITTRLWISEMTRKIKINN